MPDSPAFIHTHTHMNIHSYMHTHTHGHGQAVWTWTCDMEMDKHHGCRNANKMFSPPSSVSASLQYLVQHWHSGIVVSPVTLVTD
jgi:hypothetical protein